MKKYLIDTHILLWWLTDDSRLSKNVREILSNPKNVVFVSTVSAWEISIKLNLNSKFKMSVSLEECFADSLGFKTLPVQLDHVYELNNLEKLHKDPFDRMLIAQAISEDMTLISVDEKIKQYSKIRVIY